MTRILLTVPLFVAGMCLSLEAAAQSGKGWYTADQASQGHLLYNNHCAECHRPDLTGALGPALTGAPFSQRWGGKSVKDLYNFEHSQMPATSPGSLPPEVVIPITAYILQRNGLPSGEQPLSVETAAKLTIPAAK